MASVSSILIVGGGVAGLTAAALLARGGVACDVVEASTQPVGAAIMISGPALNALFDLVSKEALSAQGNIDPLRVGEFGGYTSLGIFRPTLSTMLTEAAVREGANVQLGVRLLDLEVDAKSATASFSDGSRKRYDAVIGADGLRSLTRSIIFPEKVTPQYSGQSCIRWMTPGDPIPNLDGTTHMSFGKLITYPLPGQIYAITVFPFELREELVPDEEVRELLLAQLDTGAAEPIRQLRDRLDPSIPLLFRPFEWLLMPRPWSSGPVALIGDAAHATTAHMGYGGGIAIEDGVVVAQSILAADTLSEAYAAFEERRYDRARHVVETSLKLSQMEQAGASPAELEAIARPAIGWLNAPY